MDIVNINAIQQSPWKDKIINEKKNRNDKNIEIDLNQTDRKNKKYKKKRSIRRNMRRLNKYLEEQHKAAPHPLIVIKKNFFLQLKTQCVILTNMRRENVDKKKSLTAVLLAIQSSTLEMMWQICFMQWRFIHILTYMISTIVIYLEII